MRSSLATVRMGGRQASLGSSPLMIWALICSKI
jgi:hypothetical protein